MGIISKALAKSRHAEKAAAAPNAGDPSGPPVDGASEPENDPAEKRGARIGSSEAAGGSSISVDAPIAVKSRPDLGQRMLENARRAAPAAAAPRPEARTAGIEEKASPAPDECRLDSDLISLCAPDSPESELFRILRSKVLFPREGHAPRSIMVTSAMSGEGKSFIAANLAVNLAKNIDQHVLLIDCDLREPSVHRKFGFDRAKGLSEYLTNGTALKPLLLKTGVDKLTLLPAGSPPENPAEILSSAKMASLMDELLARYDDRYIIIDAPPPLMVPDTSALVKKVDGILLVVQFGKTDFDTVEELIEEVGRDKIIGAVINRSKSRSSRRYAYNRHRKYGKYSRQAE